MPPSIDDLREIYIDTLARCEPARSTAAAIARVIDKFREPVDVVALGKCATGMLEGARAVLGWSGRSIAILPSGYPAPDTTGDDRGELTVVRGSHPQIGEQSFLAGIALIKFVSDASNPVLFFVSGGASACVESPLVPWFTRDDVAHSNGILLAAGLPIESMNVVRRHLSAIKGGRLALLARHHAGTFIYSDVATGRLDDVGSGPTLPDHSTNDDAAAILETTGDPVCRGLATVLRSGEVPETPRILDAPLFLIAENSDLVHEAAGAARTRGLSAEALEEQIERDVDHAAALLYEKGSMLPPGGLLVAGGEPTVTIRGDGRGGRCSELAVRFLLRTRGRSSRFTALFGSSDGLDGNSGSAGIAFDTGARNLLDISLERLMDSIARSDTFSLMQEIGSPVIIPPTGNNLRDLYLLSRFDHS